MLLEGTSLIDEVPPVGKKGGKAMVLFRAVQLGQR